jgi:hypothetical protein
VQKFYSTIQLKSTIESGYRTAIATIYLYTEYHAIHLLGNIAIPNPNPNPNLFFMLCALKSDIFGKPTSSSQFFAASCRLSWICGFDIVSRSMHRSSLSAAQHEVVPRSWLQVLKIVAEVYCKTAKSIDSQRMSQTWRSDRNIVTVSAAGACAVHTS